MSLASELERAERRLAALVNSRADAEEAQVRADKAERVRRDDLRCKDLAAEFQNEYAAHGVTPPLARADEWASDYHRRLVSGLQRRLSPRSTLADPAILQVQGQAFENFAKMIRDEAAREAYRPSPENLPASVHDPRAMRERVDSETGQRKTEFNARESFIKGLSQTGRKVSAFMTNRGPVVVGQPRI